MWDDFDAGVFLPSHELGFVFNLHIEEDTRCFWCLFMGWLARLCYLVNWVFVWTYVDLLWLD